MPGVGRRRDGDRVGRVRRRADRAVAELVEVVPRRDHRHDAGLRGARRSRGRRGRGRLDLGLAEREVDHVHPVGDRRLDRGGDLGRVAVEPEARRRDRQRLVVAEVRARRDAREEDAPRPRCRGRPRRCRRRGSRGTSRCCSGRRASPRTSTCGRRRRERALRRSPSASCSVREALREAGRIREAGRREVGVAGLDPVVDDRRSSSRCPGSRASAPRACRRRSSAARGCERSGEMRERRRRASGRSTFGQTLATPGTCASAANLGARHDDREAVGDEAVAPADLSARDRGADVALGRPPAPPRARGRRSRWRAEVSERPKAVSAGAFRVTTTSVIGTGLRRAARCPTRRRRLPPPQTRMTRRLRVRMRGLEPPRPEGTHGPEPCASTNSATSAWEGQSSAERGRSSVPIGARTAVATITSDEHGADPGAARGRVSRCGGGARDRPGRRRPLRGPRHRAGVQRADADRPAQAGLRGARTSPGRTEPSTSCGSTRKGRA